MNARSHAPRLVPAMVARHELEFEIRAPRTRVWSGLTEQIDRWWPPDFRMAPGSRRIVLEAEPLGRWYEESESGGGLVWGQVIAVTPGSSLTLVCHIAPPWGASISMIAIELDETAEITLLRLRMRTIGDIDEAGIAQMDDGWRSLFGKSLKTFVERGG